MTDDSLQFVGPHEEDASKQMPLEPVRLGGDELNLAEFPFALLTDRQPHDVDTIEFSDVIKGKDGKKITRTWILTGSEEFGLPLASDEQVYVALMELTREQGFASRVIHLTRYELSRIGHNGQHGQVGLFRQAVYSRLAGYEDTNDAERLAIDPVMRAVVEREAREKPPASTNTLSRFEPGSTVMKMISVALLKIIPPILNSL